MKSSDFKPEYYDVNISIKAHDMLCKKHGYTHFEPGNGICWRCHKNIYEPMLHKGNMNDPIFPISDYYSGITILEASTEHITGCPHCHYSFVE